MDRDTIYLDNDDEITSVVDKLKGSDFSTIDLVIPKEALVLKSVVNLKLLKKQADSLNKEITIVTQDKVGKKLAEQIGIPVIEKPGQEPKEVHMAEGEPEPQNAAKAAAAAAAASIATEEAIEFKKQAPAKAEEEESDGIEFKEATGPLEPTGEVLAAEAAKPEANPEPSSDIKPPKDKKKKRFTWKFWTILGVVTAAVLFVLAYIFIPLVHIDITLAAQKTKVDFDFSADKSYTSVDTGNQVVPAQVTTIEQSKNSQYPATGKKDAGTKASGIMAVQDVGNSTSCYSPNSSTSLVAGTRFVSTGGLVFTSTTNVTVPGCTVVGGHVTAPGASVNVNVQASQPGDQYNLGPQSFSLPGLNSTFITAKNTSAFTGGTTKQITYVTQTDFNTAKDDLAKQMNTDLVNAVTQKVGSNARLLDGSYKVEVESATSDPAVNGEGSNFTMTMKAKITAISFTEADLTKLATSILGDQIGSTKEIVDASSLTSAATVTTADFDKGTLKVKVSGEAFVASKLDQAKIKTEIAGEKNAKALEYLKGLDGVEDATITNQFPPFLKRIPRVKSHIYLNTTLDKSGS